MFKTHQFFPGVQLYKPGQQIAISSFWDDQSVPTFGEPMVLQSDHIKMKNQYEAQIALLKLQLMHLENDSRPPKLLVLSERCKSEKIESNNTIFKYKKKPEPI